METTTNGSCFQTGQEGAVTEYGFKNILTLILSPGRENTMHQSRRNFAWKNYENASVLQL